MRLEIIAICLLAVAPDLSAQTSSQPATRLGTGQGVGRGTFTVATNAPIFVVPEASREPIRVAAAGSVLQVIDVQGEWVNVEFQDPQYGRRVGFVQAKFESVRDPQVPTSPPTTPTPHPGAGFWFSGGLGYGSLGCDECFGRASGLSGGMTFGGTLSPRWLLGVGPRAGLGATSRPLRFTRAKDEPSWKVPLD